MSLKTWKAEFYSVLAADVPESDAVQHSLTKWIGLRKENLEKHRVVLHQKLLVGMGTVPFSEFTDSFYVDSESCALCIHHLKYGASNIGKTNGCSSCPLYQLRDTRCDRRKSGLSSGTIGKSPYEEFTISGNPEPMIEALTRCLDTP